DLSPQANNESWYQLPLAENRTVLTPPFNYEVDGETVLMTTISAVVHKAGKPAGVVTADLSLATIASVISQLRPFDVGNVMLISSDNQWVANADPALVGTTLAPEVAAVLLDGGMMGEGLYYTDEQGVQQFV